MGVGKAPTRCCKQHRFFGRRSSDGLANNTTQMSRREKFDADTVRTRTTVGRSITVAPCVISIKI